MHAVFYQPDIALNLGAMMRLCACMDVTLHVIDPCGFPYAPEKFKRAAMDYPGLLRLERHVNADAFFSFAEQEGLRPVLLTTKAQTHLYETAFTAGDMLIIGRESAGVPAEFAARCAVKTNIPMQGEARSMNAVTAAAVALGEAVRQTRYVNRA